MKRPREAPLWAPMFALPNVYVKFPIEVDGFALVPPNDFRINAIAKAQPRFGSFMKRFKNEFGSPLHPSVIIWRRDKPDTYRTISAISGFRDLISCLLFPSRGLGRTAGIVVWVHSIPMPSPSTAANQRQGRHDSICRAQPHL
jgi:hypothetical protein